MSGRKPAGRTGGLGVKKMSKQVDQSLFDQAPEEQAPTPATVSLILHAAGPCQRCQHLVTPHLASHVLGAADRVPMIHLRHLHAELMLTDLGAMAECTGHLCDQCAYRPFSCIITSYQAIINTNLTL